MINITIISKNLKLISDIKHFLLKEDYTVTTTSSETDFSKTDLLLYDSTSFQHDDTSFLSDIKNHNPSMPVIVFVEQGNVEFTVKLIRAGAVNALEFPVEPKFLIESIEDGLSQNVDSQQSQSVIQQAIHLLKSLQNQPGNRREAIAERNAERSADRYDRNGFLQLGDLLIDSKEEKAFYQETPIDLTPTQFRLLTILVEEKGYVVSFEELYFRLHGEHLDRTSSRTALSAHLSYLRTKLSSVGCRNYLENIRGRGYILDLPESEHAYSRKINLDLMLEQLPIILWTTDETFRITSSIGAGLAKLGLTPQDVIGVTAKTFLQTDVNHLPVYDAYQKALHGQSSTLEQKIQNHIFHIYVEPLLSDDEQVIGCMGLAFDITEHKEVDETYRKLVQQSLQGILVVQDNRIVFANPAMSTITGYSVDELMSLNDLDLLIHEEDRSCVYENIQKFLAGEDVPQSTEFRFRHKDGSLRWIEQSAFVTSFHGREAIQTAVTDRTSEKLAMVERYRMEEMYRNLVKNLPQVAVLLFDHDFRYLIAEGQSLEEAGYSRNSLEGKTVWEVLPADRVEILLPHFQSALRGQQATFEWTANNKIYEVRTLPVKNEAGEIIGGMFLIQDVAKYNFKDGNQRLSLTEDI